MRVIMPYYATDYIDPRIGYIGMYAGASAYFLDELGLTARLNS
jgi:hypothetical protein